MRILIVHRYFWPDSPPYASMLRAIAARLAADGHDVTVLSSHPSYGAQSRNIKAAAEETIDGFKVRRVWLLPESKRNFVARILNLKLFILRVTLRVLLARPAYDVVMAATTPPVLVSWALSLVARFRSTSFVYHCQDIHPELMRSAGLIGDGILYRCLRARDMATVDRAARVVVLSKDMRASLAARNSAALSHVRIINNFCIPTWGNATQNSVDIPEAKPGDGICRILFAGNLGYFQGLEAVIDAAKRLADRRDIEFVFLGEGAAKSALIERAGELVGQSVSFLGHRPQIEAEEFVRHAHLSLITLGAGICRTAYPSKTMTYLSMGSPILVMMETDCELACMTIARQLGYVIEPGNVADLVAAVEDAASSPAKILQMRASARATSAELFSEQGCMDKWSALYAELECDRNAEPVFLIGAGRSGTKYVRSMLAASDEVAAVPYDVGYVWRHGNESLPHDEIEPSQVSGSTRRFIRKTLPRLAEKEVRSKARILVEKSVPNSLRIAVLHAVFPNARFIHLVRDGRAVTESAVRQWQNPADKGYLLKKLRYFPWSNYRYAFWYVRNLVTARFKDRVPIWGPRYDGIEDDVLQLELEQVCARQWRRCVETAAAQLAEIPESQVLEVHYEDLQSDSALLRKMCEFVGIEDFEAVDKFHQANFRPVRLEKWSDALTSEQEHRVLQEIGPALEAFGYRGK